ncbi:MAG: hypothetical protein Q9223_007645 [Gallowayella weberi]
MSLVASKRPISGLLFLYPSFASASLPAARRHESSARRTTKKLRIKSDHSFTSSIPTDQLRDNVVFNPPSSSPSSYQTPAAFLPPSDPRRSLLAQSHEHTNPYAQPDKRLPQPVKKPLEKKYHLKEDDIAEIRQLRQKDPITWSRKKLAQKFDCSEFFVSMICEASPERRRQQQMALDEIKARWGKRRRYAREDRQKRRTLWARDE